MLLQPDTTLQTLRSNLDDHPPRNATRFEVLQRLLDVLHPPRLDLALDEPASNERESLLRVSDGANHASHKLETLGYELGGV